jgi:hypothetical protein
MSLSSEQESFAVDIAKLIFFIEAEPFIRARLGEGYRTEYQQKEHVRRGRSKTMDSSHRERLGQDLEFDFKFPPMESWQWFGLMNPVHAERYLREIGKYWESLHPRNVWGGNFDKDFTRPDKWLDLGHFERRI